MYMHRLFFSDLPLVNAVAFCLISHIAVIVCKIMGLLSAKAFGLYQCICPTSETKSGQCIFTKNTCYEFIIK